MAIKLTDLTETQQKKLLELPNCEGFWDIYTGLKYKQTIFTIDCIEIIWVHTNKSKGVRFATWQDLNKVFK